jgi:ElaB/YqjD/DUF883 family membrane-anchored ribosome-binding protein
MVVRGGRAPALTVLEEFMVNASGMTSKPTPDRQEDKSADPPSDNNLAENSQENLDARLDHAIEETFPTSDPVSVTITKGPEPDRSAEVALASVADDQQGHSEQEPTEEVLDQVREALQGVVDQTSGAARNLYNQREHYAQRAREQYPRAVRHVREVQQAVTQHVTGNPLLTLLIAGVAGYVLARLIHSERQSRKPYVPDYGRTDRGYAPHRDV